MSRRRVPKAKVDEEAPATLEVDLNIAQEDTRNNRPSLVSTLLSFQVPGKFNLPLVEEGLVIITGSARRVTEEGKTMYKASVAKEAKV